MHFPVSLDIQPSRRLRAAFVFVHLIAAVALLLMLPVWWNALAILGVLASAAKCWTHRPGARVTLCADGSLEWIVEDGNFVPAEILGNSTCFSHMVILRVKLTGEKRCRSLVLLADSLSDQEFRRLQIWLRWVVPFKPVAGGGPA